MSGGQPMARRLISEGERQGTPVTQDNAENSRGTHSHRLQAGPAAQLLDDHERDHGLRPEARVVGGPALVKSGKD